MQDGSGTSGIAPESAAIESQDRTAFAAGAAYVEGRFVPISEARVPILDWGFLHSDATYDVAHVWNGAFFRLEDHLDRFHRGMERLRMALPLSRVEMRYILHECVRLSGLRNAYVEMICTRGMPPAGSRDPRQAENRFFAFAIPFVWVADPAKQEQGLHLAVSDVRRIPAASVDPTVKNYHWLDFVRGLFDAYDRGRETVVLTDDAGNIAEGPGFNIFVVLGGRLATPHQGVLEGITRRTALELAASEPGLAVEERAVSSDELRAADEIFITSTAGGVIPITRIDGEAIGDGKPGAITLRLKERYWALHGDPRMSTPVSYD